MGHGLPYEVDYAKSGRSRCRKCHRNIDIHTLRFAKMELSDYFDGTIPTWHHMNCFFIKFKPKGLWEIANIDNIQWKDQELIRERIGQKSLKRSVIFTDAKFIQQEQSQNHDFAVGYAKSTLICGSCALKVDISTLVISRTSGNGKENPTNWYHLHCFATRRDFFKFNAAGTALIDYQKLTMKDQILVKDSLPVFIDLDSPEPVAKKLRVVTSDEVCMLKQNYRLMTLRDNLKVLKRTELVHLLASNGQKVPKRADLLTLVCDQMAFGALSTCKKCGGWLELDIASGYKCNRWSSTYSRCETVIHDPERTAFVVPDLLKHKYPFLANYQPTIQQRVFRSNIGKPANSVTTRRTVSNVRMIQSNNITPQCQSIFRLKRGEAIAFKSGLADIAHVYKRGTEKFTVTLGLTDITWNVNKYYIMQILEHDLHQQYWIFKSWGRTGTDRGGEKLEQLSLDACIVEFERVYFERTKNHWSERSHFVKIPGSFYPMELSHEPENKIPSLFSQSIKSNLQEPVQDLMKLIFNRNIMNEAMVEYNLDARRMPLGKLSKGQLFTAYNVLTELQSIVKYRCIDDSKIVQASNQFYTLIPHCFGASSPPLLDNLEIIKQKCDMINSLLNLEIAYKILNEDSGSDKNILDTQYDKLHVQIDVLNKESEEYEIIDTFVKNTHGETHLNYNLEIEEVFVIKRQGEEERYRPFQTFHNRKLLWHGSRTTNFASILSQGLRIAPPEAPPSGYMFGKGIYFADMVSKSANYCATSHGNPSGLLLLCEVALGNMLELVQAKYVNKLPPNYHSVFGVGRTCPDPDLTFVNNDGVEIPCGPAVTVQAPNLQLLYNEYIVYDEAQVQAKYLVRMKFNHNY